MPNSNDHIGVYAPKSMTTVAVNAVLVPDPYGPSSAYLVEADVYLFGTTLLAFPREIDLQDRCGMVYERFGQVGVVEFIDEFYADSDEVQGFGPCLACEFDESPIDSDDCCLVCGSMVTA